ncbi:ARM repeat-containing protein [Polychaeton citri CBS 116435]|uniref:ARM repeat-containing protein n=1 Tax=Polychaeton citri CBS 116435 TaxID=1314669 RepID=A0A9P4Q799_9PEZI|nr:ARM repeat-containing protein [Polychaeton citri CBS 116435]
MTDTATEELVNPPQTLAEVEELVKRLYQPGSPLLLHSIQAQLQSIQRSSDGWQLADTLLASNDRNVRFFGALTFQVKLNNDGAKLELDTAQQVLSRLIHWLVVLNQQNEAAFVQKKVCSALTTYFLQSPAAWQAPLPHLAASLQHGDVQDGNVADFAALLATLNAQQLLVLLWFASVLAEELSRIDNVSPSTIRFHDQMEVIAPSVNSLMACGFRQESDSVQAGALSCFSNWVNYAQPMWPTKPEAMNYLRDLLEPALKCSLVPSLEDEALGIIRDLLETYTSFFHTSHMDMIGALIEQHFGPKFCQAMHDQDSDAIDFSQLLVAYSIADIQHIVEQPNRPTSQMVMDLHLKILQTGSHPGEPHDMSLFVVEFWNTYIEYIIDTVYSGEDDEKPEWVQYAKHTLMQANRLIWEKMWPPPPGITKDWTSDERNSFKEFRQDAAEILSSNFVILGRDMVQQLVHLTLESLKAQQWQALEAGLCCLKALADNVMENSLNDDLLALLFGSTLFRDIADFGRSVSAQARKTAVDLLGEYSDYIERHSEYLPDTLRFLFSSLETAALANTAARSIVALCECCRLSLIGELDAFLQQYQRFMDGPTSIPENQEKVMGAIAAIIQAVSPESAKAGPLNALLDNVEVQIGKAKESASKGDMEDAEYTGVGALNSLGRIGRSMQVPMDSPINLDDETSEGQTSHTSFWNTKDGIAIQHRIVNALSVLQVLNNSGDAVCAACLVLRSGFTESAPGPFVLPASVTVSFLLQFPVDTPQIEEVLATAGILIVQHSTSTSSRIEEETNAILQKSLSYISHLGVPSTDPGIAQSCIDVCERMLPAYANIVFGMAHSEIGLLLNFTISALTGPDPLPKRSACEFWSKMIRLLGPQSIAQAHNAQPQAQQVIMAFGLKLSAALISQIRGEASRSDLDDLCKPLKAIVFYVPQSRRLLETAMFDEHASNPDEGRVSDIDKKRFIDQVVADRGGNKTRELVKAFWINSRGTISFGT